MGGLEGPPIPPALRIAAKPRCSASAGERASRRPALRAPRVPENGLPDTPRSASAGECRSPNSSLTQHGHVAEVPVDAAAVEAVPDDVDVGDGETHVVDLHRDLTALR